MATKKAIDYIKKYNMEHYDRITLMVPKGTRETVKARARALGKSTNEYVNGLIVVDLCGGENESAD